MDRGEVLVELVAAVDVDVLPGHRGDTPEDLGAIQVAAELQLGQRLGQDQGVADKSGTLVPGLLLVL